jgi:hypothetical protein
MHIPRQFTLSGENPKKQNLSPEQSAIMVLARGHQYQFYFDIISYQYQGPKSDTFM